jgi:sarcosine oxidase
MTIHKDVVVVGLGAFGSAALWRLAGRGVDVAGIERQGIGHQFGSSHGTTRLFRIACLEHPGLTPIAQQSLALWTELGERTGEVFVRQSGCLNVGAPDSRAIRGVIAAALAAGVPIEELGHDELAARYPQYAGLGADDVAVWDPGAGICYAEPIVRAQVAEAERLGAAVYPHTMVTGVELVDGGVVVRTPTVELRARQVVVCAGAWLGKLVADLPLAPRRTPLYWFRAKDPGEFDLGRFPAFVWKREGGHSLWGHGSGDGFGVKVGLDHLETEAGRLVVDPDDVDRYIHLSADVDELAETVAEAFPGLEPRPEKVLPCMITDSPDGQFLVGRPGEDPRLVIAGGDSGHGFKHAAGLGELLAQLTVGESPYCDATFLDPNRFTR